MTPDQLALLREPFPPEEVGKLPRITCPKCRDAQAKVCGDHAKSRCPVCENWITGAHMHLDYVGHAETTDRLLSVDPEWSWEPVAWTEDGSPAIARHGSNLVMWGRLTVLGVTRLGVGTAGAGKDDAHKELIGDFLRNAAMRFGVALDLWRKSERADAHAETEPEQEAPKPRLLRGPLEGIIDVDLGDVANMRPREVMEALKARGIVASGTVDDLRAQLAEVLASEAPQDVSSSSSTETTTQVAGPADNAPSEEAPAGPVSIDPVVVERLVKRVEALPDDLREVAHNGLAAAVDGRWPDSLTPADMPDVMSLIADWEGAVQDDDLAARARRNVGRTKAPA